jgi:hypothetical protein
MPALFLFIPNVSTPFISPDLGASTAVTKSGYVVAMTGLNPPAPGAQVNACNGIAMANLDGSYYATADPSAPQSTGTRYFWTNTLGTIFQDLTAPIGSTVGGGMPGVATATALQ